MTNGFSATITMSVQGYAEGFAAAGNAALRWYQRNFGISDGEPRQQAKPWLQARGYLSALDFLAQHPGIDPQRKAVWGDSMSGAVVLLVAACDDRVRAVVSQVGACGRSGPPPDPDESRFAMLRQTLLDGDIAATPETKLGPMPVVSADQAGTPSLSSTKPKTAVGLWTGAMTASTWPL